MLYARGKHQNAKVKLKKISFLAIHQKEAKEKIAEAIETKVGTSTSLKQILFLVNHKVVALISSKNKKFLEAMVQSKFYKSKIEVRLKVKLL